MLLCSCHCADGTAVWRPPGVRFCFRFRALTTECPCCAYDVPHGQSFPDTITSQLPLILHVRPKEKLSNKRPQRSLCHPHCLCIHIVTRSTGTSAAFATMVKIPAFEVEIVSCLCLNTCTGLTAMKVDGSVPANRQIRHRRNVCC